MDKDYFINRIKEMTDDINKRNERLADLRKFYEGIKNPDPAIIELYFKQKDEEEKK
jgi:benzoyl-CoA reductase/2-hydroxyglutaryl-CoA dehydratase subunit BcrC/BadD/HgdB